MKKAITVQFACVDRGRARLHESADAAPCALPGLGAKNAEQRPVQVAAAWLGVRHHGADSAAVRAARRPGAPAPGGMAQAEP